MAYAVCAKDTKLSAAAGDIQHSVIGRHPAKMKIGICIILIFCHGPAAESLSLPIKLDTDSFF